MFAEWGLRQPRSTAIDVPALLASAEGADAQARHINGTIGEAIAGVIGALVALADPRTVDVGGGWGPHLAVLGSVVSAVARRPRTVPIRAATVRDEPALTGARQRARDELRAVVLAGA